MFLRQITDAFLDRTDPASSMVNPAHIHMTSAPHTRNEKVLKTKAVSDPTSCAAAASGQRAKAPAAMSPAVSAPSPDRTARREPGFGDLVTVMASPVCGGGGRRRTGKTRARTPCPGTFCLSESIGEQNGSPTTAAQGFRGVVGPCKADGRDPAGFAAPPSPPRRGLTGTDLPPSLWDNPIHAQSTRRASRFTPWPGGTRSGEDLK